MKLRRLLASGIAVALLASMISVGSASVSMADPEIDSFGAHVPETVLVQFKDAKLKDKLMKKYGLEEAGKVYGTDTYVMKASGKEAKALAKLMRKDSDLVSVELDGIATVDWTPNDPSFSSQWGPKKISSEAAWNVTRGSSSVMIAVVDTGVDLDHPDLNGKVRTDIDYDFVNNDSNASDDNGHGTHVAGIAAAETNNSTGIAGVCPNCTILPVKVLSASGSGSYSAIASGIRYAADKGAKVINLSLGGSSGSSTLSDAVNYANNKGAILACAAGNSNTSAASYPAYYSACVAVASTDSNDYKSSFSNYGSWVDTSAPGSSIYATYWNNTYKTLSGTSMAAPHVAGLAGMLFSQGRSQSAVRTRLTSSTYTDPVNSSSIPRRINAYKAVAY